jgi:hypothetical protein
MLIFCRQALVTNTDGIAKLLAGKLPTLNMVSAELRIGRLGKCSEAR